MSLCKTLFSLVEKGAQRRFPVRLTGSIVLGIQIGDLHLMQQRLENRGADRARHAGERKYVDNAVKSVMRIFQRTADTDGRFGADIKTEQPFVFQLSLQGANVVVPLNVQVAQSSPINLLLTPGLIELFDFLSKPFAQRFMESTPICLFARPSALRALVFSLAHRI